MKKRTARRLAAATAFALPGAAGVMAATQPNPVILTPASNSSVSGRNVVALARFNAPRPVAMARLLVDGQVAGERKFSPAVGTGSVTFGWDSNTAGSGAHKIVIQLFDKSSRMIGQSGVPVNVGDDVVGDTTPPQIAIVEPANGAEVEGVIDVKILATDNSGQNPYVSLFVDKDLRSVTNSAPYSFPIDTTNHPNGKLTLEAYAYDAVDNKGIANTVTLNINNPGGATALDEEINTPTPTPVVEPIPTTAAPVVASVDAPLPVKPTAPAKPVRMAAEVQKPVIVSPKPTPIVPKKKPTVPMKPATPPEEQKTIAAPKAEKKVAPAPKPVIREIAPSPAKPLMVPPAKPIVIPKQRSTAAPQPDKPVRMARADIAAPKPVVTPAPIVESDVFVPAAPKPVLMVKAPAQVARPEVKPTFTTEPVVHVPNVATRQSAPVKAVRPAKSETVLDPVFVQELPVDRVKNGNIIHAARPGETATKIARRYGVPARKLASANHIKPKARLEVGRPVVVPTPVRIAMNGIPVQFDVAPRVEDGMTLVPIRHLYERSGGSLTWNPKTRMVHATGARADISLRIGADFAMVNGKAVKLDAPIRIENGRTLVPTRFLAEALDMKAEYDLRSGSINLTR